MLTIRRPLHAGVATFALALGTLAGCTAAYAQNASPPFSTPSDDGGQASGEIIVTGTHIARPELESAMPIRVTSMEDAKNFGRNTIYDALMLNPAVGPGLGEMNSGGQEYDQGVANINLRQMGANRSLVVVDGHRWVSGGARTSAVDLNTIPTALIDRVEVVTGGAAAIYGADAVTGAVNIVMKKNVTGLHLTATNGISEQGDARQSDISVATGFDFGGGRGHFVIGGNYSDTAPLAELDRWNKRYTYQPNPKNTGPNDGIADNILIDYHQFYRSHYPTFCIYGTAGMCGTNNGNWYQLIDNSVVAIPKDSYTVVTSGDTGIQNGGPDSAFGIYDLTLLRAKSAKASTYAHASYELTPALTWNAVFGYAHSYNRMNPEWPQYRDDARPTNWWGTNGVGTTGEIARLTDPYLPDSLRSFMIANNLKQISLDRQYTNIPTSWEIHERDAFTLGTDLGGKLAGKLNWQTFVRYGQIIDNITTTNTVGRDEWLQSRNAIVDPASGQIVCANAAARAAGCVPFNYYTTDAPNQAWIDYAEKERYEWTKNSMLNAGANIDGSLLPLPYGDLSIAAGFEWRRETLHTRDDPDTAKLADIIWSPGMDLALHPALSHRRDTTELYGEAVIPLLRDLPFARRLEIEGAVRYSHYSDNPDTTTWKAGGSWEPVQGLTFRGTYSHSVRVPNFGELFSPVGMVTLGHISDPCQDKLITQDNDRAANCAATVPNWTGPLPNPNLNAPRVFSGGNPNLTPETSNSLTVGAVFQPRFLQGFDLTMDYWDIKIDNVITSLAYTTILNNCVNATGGPDMAYCQFVHRDPVTGEVDYVQAQYANLAGQRARGIDIGANYRIPLGKGQVRINFNGTYLLEQTTISQVGTPGIDYAGQWNYPRFKATLLTSFTLGRLTLGVNTRLTGSAKYNATAQSDETYEIPRIPAYVYNDVTVNFRLNEQYAFSLGVKNISNTAPPLTLRDVAISPHQSAGTNAGGAYYDAIGRYFFAKIDANF
ncbi:TonB-dependent receptor domain-containing protein [Sphingobium sp. EM0848]|uniref:TonB-dependent receptor domain-containing protein n=1 Tax=Sphingobium sp. EM0848 TaxID=2743473 RepID=UPI00159BF797|nr:TonB-dependent receptor [Sphingobium sp. EM0848]